MQLYPHFLYYTLLSTVPYTMKFFAFNEHISNYFDNQGETASFIPGEKKNFKKAAKGQQTVCHPIFLPQIQLRECVQRKADGEIPSPRERRP